MAVAETDRETERETEKEEKVRGGEEEVRETEKELQFLLVPRFFSRPSCAHTYKAPSLARIYSTRKWRGREGARDERTVKRRKTLFSVV